MDPMTRILPKVKRYLETHDLPLLGIRSGEKWTVTPLAQGEYNLNYHIVADRGQWVFRVNVGTQIQRDDQIRYEYQALCLLRESTVTPIPFHVDDSRTFFDTGILIMQYLPGTTLDYHRDLAGAARVLAAVHQVFVDPAENHLIREERPLSLIFQECAGLLQRYFDSPLAEPRIKAYLERVLAWTDQQRPKERYYQHDPWFCIVNTEVNSGNFIVNRPRQSIHLVDWEMPRWGDPSQDLAHFCSPLTTLWKTDYRMSTADREDFLAAYRACINDPHLRQSLDDRLRLRTPFVYLRGISWSAMGWTAYQTGYDGVRNPSTWKTLQNYMNLEFIRSLFDPVMG